jgi:hypothetical protein
MGVSPMGFKKGHGRDAMLRGKTNLTHYRNFRSLVDFEFLP